MIYISCMLISLTQAEQVSWVLTAGVWGPEKFLERCRYTQVQCFVWNVVSCQVPSFFLFSPSSFPVLLFPLFPLQMWLNGSVQTTDCFHRFMKALLRGEICLVHLVFSDEGNVLCVSFHQMTLYISEQMYFMYLFIYLFCLHPPLC